MPSRADAPLRLLVLTTSYPLTRDSVSGIFVARLIEHLPRHISATIVTPDSSERVASTESSRFAVHRFRYAARPLQLLAHSPGGIPATLRARKWTYLLLPGFLLSMFIACLRQARRADLIHANWAICGCVAGIVGKIRRVPVVTTLRGSDVARAESSLLDRWVLSLCIKLADRVVAVSDSIARQVRRQYPSRADHVCTIENGVEDSFFALGEKRQERATSSSLRLLTVGSLTRNKSVDRIIDALRELAADNIALTIVGDGPERQRLADRADAYRLRDRIRFLGQLPAAGVLAELASADVFVLASRSEGRPNVILEAMAAALPVVASDIAGVDELVAHESTGFRFPPDDTTTLSVYLRRLAEDSALRARFGRAAHTWMLNRGLRWSATAERYCKLYTILVQHRSTCAA